MATTTAIVRESPQDENEATATRNQTTRAKNARRRSLVNILFHLPSRQISSSTCPSVAADPNSTSTRTLMLEEEELDELARSIPLDVLKEIVEYLPVSDMLSLSLASKHVHSLLLPSLYHTVTLSSSSSCMNTLSFLLSNPSLSSLIHKIVLRPNYYLSWPREDVWVDERTIAGMVEKIAMNEQGTGLVRLETFDWDGLEMPGSSLWTTLRTCCPRLKNVFTNVGRTPIDPKSSLFSFTDLTSFSMIVRHGLGGSELFPTPTILPPRLWNMLLHSCPNLKELALCSFSSSFKTLNFDKVVEGRWPMLKTLTLGGFGYERDFGVGPRAVLGNTLILGAHHAQAQGNANGQGQTGQTTGNSNVAGGGSTNAASSSNAQVQPPDSPLGRFMDAHKELKYVRFLWNFKRWMSPENIGLHLSDTVSLLPTTSTSTSTALSKTKSHTEPNTADLYNSLPAVETFIGIYQQLSPLPSFHPTFSSIRTLDLTCEPIYEQRVPALSSVLKRLVNLKSLDIWVHLHFDESRANRIVRGVGWTRRDRDYTGFYEQVFGSCAGLEELHWMVTTGFGAAPLTQLLSKLHLVPLLKRFSLTKGHRYTGDESMLKTAVRILKYGYNQEKKKRTSTQRRSSSNSALRDTQPGTTTILPSPSPGASSLGATSTSTTLATVPRPVCHNLNPNMGSQAPTPHSSSRPILGTSESTPIVPSSDLSPSSSTPSSSSSSSGASSSSFFSDPQPGSAKIAQSTNNSSVQHPVACETLATYPRLEQISIRWAREKCANHLKQEGTYDVIYADEDEDEGEYIGPTGRGGTARNRVVVALEAAERGIPAVGKPFLRRYRHCTLSLGSKRGRGRGRGKGSVGAS